MFKLYAVSPCTLIVALCFVSTIRLLGTNWKCQFAGVFEVPRTTGVSPCFGVPNMAVSSLVHQDWFWSLTYIQFFHPQKFPHNLQGWQLLLWLQSLFRFCQKCDRRYVGMAYNRRRRLTFLTAGGAFLSNQVQTIPTTIEFLFCSSQSSRTSLIVLILSKLVFFSKNVFLALAFY